MANISNFYTSITSSDYSVESSNKRFSTVYRIANYFQLISWPEYSIFDFGCGPANFLNWLQKNTIFAYYYGYDIRQETIAYNKRTIEQKDNIEFSTEFPTKNFDITLLLGTISYKYDTIEECKYKSHELIDKAYQKTNKGIFFTLPKKYYKEPQKPMITYSINEVYKELEQFDFTRCTIDIETFPHEYIIALKK